MRLFSKPFVFFKQEFFGDYLCGYNRHSCSNGPFYKPVDVIHVSGIIAVYPCNNPALCINNCPYIKIRPVFFPEHALIPQIFFIPFFNGFCKTIGISSLKQAHIHLIWPFIILKPRCLEMDIDCLVNGFFHSFVCNAV